MDWFRLWHTIRMYTIYNAFRRAEYLKRHKIFKHVGDNCMVMFRKIPLHSKLISFQDNVRIATNVTFITHDVIYSMLNTRDETDQYTEYKDCIDIRENVFIGANSTVLPGVRIWPNVIVGACTLVNKDIKEGVYAGNPVRYICSLEDFIEKRQSTEATRNQFLREGNEDEYWDWFNQIRNNQKQ